MSKNNCVVHCERIGSVVAQIDTLFTGNIPLGVLAVLTKTLLTLYLPLLVIVIVKGTFFEAG